MFGRSPFTIIVIFGERSKNSDHFLAGVYNRMVFKPKKYCPFCFSYSTHSTCISSMIMSHSNKLPRLKKETLPSQAHTNLYPSWISTLNRSDTGYNISKVKYWVKMLTFPLSVRHNRNYIKDA